MRGRPPWRRVVDGPVSWGAAGLVVAVALWALVVAAGLVPRSSLPSPAAVGSAAWDLVNDGDFRSHFGDTLTSWWWALLLSTAIAVPLGLLIGYLRALSVASDLLIHIARSVPASALIPVAIIFFGLGSSMKVAIVTFSVVWIILLNTIYGVRNVDPMSLRVARSMRFSRPEVVWRVLLPTAAPSIATGIRVATGIAFIVTLSAELLGATRGVGTVVVSYQDAQRPAYVYGGIVLVALTGMLLNFLSQFAERRVIRWQPSVRPS